MIGKIKKFVRGGAKESKVDDESKPNVGTLPSSAEPKAGTLPSDGQTTGDEEQETNADGVRTLPPDGQTKDRDFAHCLDPNFDASNIKTTELEPFVWVFENVLTQEECKKLIEFGENEGFESFRFYTQYYRTNTRVMIRCQEAADMLYERMAPLLPEDYEETYNKMTSSWKRKSLNEVFRFCRYEKGQHFSPHLDSDFKRSKDERSMFTFQLYLNGDFEGGATRFYKGKATNIGKEFKHILPPKQGSLLVFKHDMLHDGQRLHSGLKYILRSDVMFERCAAERE